jgi:hypothetical protein
VAGGAGAVRLPGAERVRPPATHLLVGLMSHAINTHALYIFIHTSRSHNINTPLMHKTSPRDLHMRHRTTFAAHLLYLGLPYGHGLYARLLHLPSPSTPHMGRENLKHPQTPSLMPQASHAICLGPCASLPQN